uniref:Gln2 n=1 Tax=Arundo donax TaxID=35708 RepID=A0A0A8Y8N6_ARUDO
MTPLEWLGSQSIVVSAINEVTTYGSMLDAGLLSSK